MTIKSVAWTTAKYLLAVSVLAFVIHANWEPTDEQGGLRDVWHKPIDRQYLILALLLHVCSLTVILYRWHILVRAQDLPCTLFQAVRLGTLGFVCSAFLPGAVGGDLVRATALAREQSRRTVAVATVVMDRALSVWGIVFIVAAVGGACWLFDLLDAAVLGPARPIILTATIIIVASVIAWVAAGCYAPTLADATSGGALSQLWHAAWLYHRRPGSVVAAAALSVMSTACESVAFYCYARTLSDGTASNALPGLSEHFLIVPIGLLISGIPLFPGGAGIGEAGFGGLYKLFGFAAANGVLGSLLFRVSGWALGIAGYLGCLLTEAMSRPESVRHEKTPGDADAPPGVG
ncbi:MAG: flippase-like domain-containing protein [Planctomycetes bacterium]|nr:flippase-like domain-containing protein [Planctomycetota bacterium]